MISLKNNIYHSHFCGKINAKHIGAEVKVAGWVNSIRKLGGITFLTLRDQTGIVQVFVADEKYIEDVTRESVVSIGGLVRARGEKNVNPDMETGEIEIELKSIEMLGKCTEILPFEVANSRDASEYARLKYRYLDLRNPQNYNNILLRAKLLEYVREQMRGMEFTEVQTPILTSSSPEGARDFLVPSRLNPGQFYALPQSPQQFKQLLMVSGFSRYFQIAPCFRDEDARADRSPVDFYQVDMEMSFATQDEVLEVMEKLLYNILTTFSDYKVDPLPFVRIPFNTAMKEYGSDKPDLRNPLKLVDITKEFNNHEFTVFNGKFLQAIVANCGEAGRRFYDALTDYIKLQGAGGLVYFKVQEDGTITGPAAKYMTEENVKTLLAKTNAKAGDSIFVIADAKLLKSQKLAGLLRNELGAKLNLIDEKTFKPCFIVDFPFYEEDDNGKPEFSHNPFSMPQGGLDALLNKNPLDIYAYQYDAVLNGVELASGAVRNHSPEIMVKAFEIAGYTRDVVENKFPALFNAFKFGAPPHAGCAFGFDRLVMFLTEETSIKEVLTFPMNKSAQDPLMGAPTTVTQQQLDDVYILLNKEKIEKTKKGE